MSALPPAGGYGFFAYGTLMGAGILQAASGCALPGVPALLRGYERRRVAGDQYRVFDSLRQAERGQQAEEVGL